MTCTYTLIPKCYTTHRHPCFQEAEWLTYPHCASTPSKQRILRYSWPGLEKCGRLFFTRFLTLYLSLLQHRIAEQSRVPALLCLAWNPFWLALYMDKRNITWVPCFPIIPHILFIPQMPGIQQLCYILPAPADRTCYGCFQRNVFVKYIHAWNSSQVLLLCCSFPSNQQFSSTVNYHRTGQGF